MPNLGMPDLNQYKMNPFSKDKSPEKQCSTPMILADAISMTNFKDFGSSDDSNIIYRGRVDRVDYNCNFEPNYSVGDLYITGTISLGQKASGNLYSLPAFVAIIKNNKEVISRKYIDIDVNIPDDATLARFEYVNSDFTVNFEQSKDPGDYQILVGFKLTADQVEFNKNRN
tara:strand:- start:2213 stop:2725 length:513 start_codon:yes stop_codon:yes gene_type:complete